MTRKGSQVRVLYGPPQKSRSEPCGGLHDRSRTSYGHRAGRCHQVGVTEHGVARLATRRSGTRLARARGPLVQWRSGCCMPCKVAECAVKCKPRDVGTEPGRRDRKRLATHQALRSCALELVLRRGLDKVTVEDIAEAADVSVRTFFNHFPSKEDAVIGFDVDQANSLGQAVLDRPDDEPPLEALRAVMRALAGEMAEGGTDWQRRMEIVRRIPDLAPRLLASFAACERALIEAVAFRSQARAATQPVFGTCADSAGGVRFDDLQPTLAALTSVAALRAAVLQWCDIGRRGSLLDLVDQAFDLLEHGASAFGGTGRAHVAHPQGSGSRSGSPISPGAQARSTPADGHRDSPSISPPSVARPHASPPTVARTRTSPPSATVPTKGARCPHP